MSEAIDEALKGRALGLFSPFAVVEGVEQSFDMQAKRGRDFSAARATNETEVYNALQAYASEQHKFNRRVAIACYSNGSAERMAGLLRTHNLSAQTQVPNLDTLRKMDAKAGRPYYSWP